MSLSSGLADMASTSSSITLQGTLLRSNFLGQNSPPTLPQKPCSLVSRGSRFRSITSAKFNLSEILGGRGLCNGEKGLQEELKKNVQETPSAPKEEKAEATTESVPDDAFDKEMMGLTGGFPGGEKGLQKFIAENPPPPKKQGTAESVNAVALASSKKPKPPELPLLMPGMIAIVKNQNSPYYKYCGIVQRITDGKAAVLFEGGVWDRLITFRLDELERREKGPPGKNPRSVIIEEQQASK